MFIANQALEYTGNDFTLSSHAYGSIFYLSTGFHGLHVIGGLIFMAAVAGVIRGASRAPTGLVVDMCGYYWHFVDVVWIGLFFTIYVIQ